MKPKKCLQCSKSFTASRSDAKYCSTKCRQKVASLAKKISATQNMVLAGINILKECPPALATEAEAALDVIHQKLVSAQASVLPAATTVKSLKAQYRESYRLERLIYQSIATFDNQSLLELKTEQDATCCLDARLASHQTWMSAHNVRKVDGVMVWQDGQFVAWLDECRQQVGVQ